MINFFKLHENRVLIACSLESMVAGEYLFELEEYVMTDSEILKLPVELDLNYVGTINDCHLGRFDRHVEERLLMLALQRQCETF